MKSFIFAKSVNDQPIFAHKFGGPSPKVLILGGVHGNEWEGVFAAKALLGHFMSNYDYNLEITIVPEFNADGVLKGQRKNANSVDLNRNLPSNDWTSEVAKDDYHPGQSPGSEPENQGLVTWLKENQPQFVLSLHSWNPLLNTNGDCHPEAEAIRVKTGYEIKESIGYPTPGCLGTYCGLERDMPTLTYEIQRDIDPKEIIKTHLPAILDGLRVSEKRFNS